MSCTVGDRLRIAHGPGPIGALAIAVVLAQAGCADLRDFLRPYAPDAATVDALRNRPAPFARADAALVLGCPADYDGSPSECQRCRIDAAVEVYRRGWAHTLLFSGGAAHSADVEADVMARAAVEQGVPAEALLREDRALTTWQNARHSTRMLEAHGLSRVLVVSTAGHLPRARRMLAWNGLDDAHSAYLACDRPLPEHLGPAEPGTSQPRAPLASAASVHAALQPTRSPRHEAPR